MPVQVFTVPIFFICFRECLETTIIASVLLSFLKQALDTEGNRATYKRLTRQVWWGIGLGFFICVCIGSGMIGAFYTLKQDYYARTEDAWEGAFSLLASVIISIVGAALLRVSKLQDKWRVKLAQALQAKTKPRDGAMAVLKQWAEKYAMFLLPFVTVLREGLEAVVFIGGVSLSSPASGFPLAVFCGLLAGIAVGYLMYRGGNRAPLQVFLIISTCFLYLVAAGLLSKAVGFFEANTWNNLVGGDVSEVGSGPGSYNIRQSVWHVNCCNPMINGGGGWGIFYGILGWTNSATYGTVLSYNLYWAVVIVYFTSMGYKERYGRLPGIEWLVRRQREHQHQTVWGTHFEATAAGSSSPEEIRICSRPK